MPQFIPAPAAGGGTTLDSVYSPAGSVLVAGAGTATVNGVYEPNGTTNGKQDYQMVGDELATIEWYVDEFSSQWNISYNAESQYYSEDAVDTPDLVTTWNENSGSVPVPTVTAFENYPDGYLLEADGAGGIGWALPSTIGHFPSAVDYYDSAEVDLILTAADTGKVIVINYTADGANGYHTVTLPAAAAGLMIGVICKTVESDINIHIKPASGDEIVIMRGNTAEYIFDENYYYLALTIQIILVAVNDSKWFALSETDYGQSATYLHWQQWTMPP